VVTTGEQLGGLVDASNALTGLRLVASTGWNANGRVNGGLLWPSEAPLGDLAVGQATQDYWFVEAGRTGALFVEGLDPGSTYRLRFFASRQAEDTRVTRYAVTGASTVQVELTVGGPGVGAEGGNDASVAQLSGVAPDAWGRLHLDVTAVQGDYAYLALLEVVAE